jgi:hypothetical protein
MRYYGKCDQGSSESGGGIFGRREVNRSIFERDVGFYVIIYT